MRRPVQRVKALSDTIYAHPFEEFGLVAGRDETELDLAIDVVRLPEDFLEKLPRYLQRRIIDGEGGPQTADEQLDRSANDWYIACQLIQLGYEPGVALAVLTHSSWVSGAKARQSGAHYAQLTTARAAARTTPRREPRVVLPARVWSGEAFMAASFKPPEWLIEDIWLARNIGFISGDPKVHKTWLVLDMALSIASGKDFLGAFPVRRTGVAVIIQREDPEAYLQDRLAKIATARGFGAPQAAEMHGKKLRVKFPPPFPPLYISTTPEFVLDDEDAIPNLMVWLDSIVAAHGSIEFIAMDPLLKLVLQVDIDKAVEVSRYVFKPLDTLRQKYDCAVAVVHHHSKHSDSSRGGRRMYGSVVLHAFAESALYVKRASKGGLGHIEVEPEFKSAAPKPFTVQFVELEERYEITVGRGRPTLEAVAAFLKQAGGTATMDDFEAHFGVPQSVLKSVIREALEEDVIVRKRGARRAGGTDMLTLVEDV